MSCQPTHHPKYIIGENKKYLKPPTRNGTLCVSPDQDCWFCFCQKIGAPAILGQPPKSFIDSLYVGKHPILICHSCHKTSEAQSSQPYALHSCAEDALSYTNLGPAQATGEGTILVKTLRSTLRCNSLTHDMVLYNENKGEIKVTGQNSKLLLVA